MKELTVKELAAYFDHTQLKAYAQKEDFEKLCREADEYGFAMVAINSSPVACCKELLKDSKLVIEKINAVTYCEDCKSEYETVKYGKICPKCGSRHTYLLRGSEFNIKEIEAC